MNNKEIIAETEFSALEQKIERILVILEQLRQENQRLREEIDRLNSQKTATIERINLMLDKIDNFL